MMEPVCHTHPAKGQPRVQRSTGPQSILLAALAFALTGCASTVPIGRLLDEPQRYDGRTVQVEGTVTRSAGLLGIGAYEVEDGTGSIVVIASGQGVPREGARTRAKGVFESVFSWAGRTIAAIVVEDTERR